MLDRRRRGAKCLAIDSMMSPGRCRSGSLINHRWIPECDSLLDENSIDHMKLMIYSFIIEFK